MPILFQNICLPTSIGKFQV